MVGQVRELFSYMDYRAFLRDFYEGRKESNPIWSYRFMSGRLEVDSGQLVRILQGKLHLPPRAMGATIRLCGLEGRDAAYFEELVRYGKAKSRDESSRSLERLIALRGVDSAPLSQDQADYYRSWHHTVVRSLLGMAPFRGDWKTLASLCTPEVTAQQAQESVELLERLGIVQRDEQGTLRLAERHVSPGAGVPPQIVRQFQKDTIDLAKTALDNVPRQEREISTITMALSEADIELVQGWIRDLRRRIQTLADSTRDPDRVFHLNVQLFPVTKKVRRKKTLPDKN